MVKIVEEQTEEIIRSPVSIEMDKSLHELAKNLAKRKGWRVPLIYENALRDFFNKPENYMGKSNEPKGGKK